MTEYTVKVGFWVRGYDDTVIEVTPETVIEKAKEAAAKLMELQSIPTDIDPERRDGVIVYIDSRFENEVMGENIPFDDDSIDSPLGKTAPRMLEALKAIADIPDPKSGDRGPIKVARHIAKAMIKEVESST